MFDDNGDAAFGFNAKLSVDEHWAGPASDPDHFDGGSNKNDDLIGLGEEPWLWTGNGGGPQKNDITNTYFHTRVDGNGDRWVFVAAETRSTHGDSHVDFEFNQAGLTVTGATFDADGNIISGSGQIIGNGPDGGRTGDGTGGLGFDDFIVSIDFEQGGVSPIASVRVWEGSNFSAAMSPLDFPGLIFSATNLADICHDADGMFDGGGDCGASPGTWTHFTSGGDATSVLSEFQLVEAGFNLTQLGIDVDVCATEATFTVKTRSSQSFTAELKDFELVPFPLEPTPECQVNGPDAVCPGTQDITYTAEEITGLSGVTFEWEIMGDATFDDGSNMATGETVTVDVDLACDAGFELWVTVATEFCDNTCHKSVTVDDDEAPTITCPPDVTLECPADTSPGNTGTATCSDNCTCSVSFSDSVAPGCGNTEVITRTWTATDDCGNTASCDQVITVVDTTAPTITCPADVTLECPADTTPGNTGTATCSDTCGGCSVDFSDSVVQGCGGTGVITRTWTATDDCGNQSSCDQIITVVDTTPPSITCPQDVTLECPADTSPSNTGVATCMDGCGTCTVSFSDSSVPGCGNTEVITRTWTATDSCGLINSCDQIITVVDTTAPTITCPPDVTLECPADTSPSNTGTATCSDTCGGCTVDFTDSVVPGCADTEVITRTWTATDDCGNTASCDQVITVVDTTAPVITSCPGGGELTCGVPFPFKITATDDCGDVTFSCSVSTADPDRVEFTDLGGGQFSIELTGTATATVTCTATDECDNVSEECVFTVFATCNQACSPGFWKNNLADWVPTGFSPADDFLDAFDITDTSGVGNNTIPDTLSDAVNLNGGSFNQAHFHGVAALLSAAHPDVGFAVDVSAVKAAMQTAYATGAFAAAHNTFAFWNSFESEGGCPLSGGGGPIPVFNDDVPDAVDSIGSDDPSGIDLSDSAGSGEPESSSSSQSTTMRLVGDGIDVEVQVEDPSAIEPGRIVGIVINDGLLEPRHFNGLFEVVGHYVQTPEGRLHIELGGVEPVEGYDVLRVQLDAVLHGTLAVSLVDGFTLQVGDSFRIVTATSIHGEFDSVNLPELFDVVLEASYEETAVVLRVDRKPLVGDFNHDGRVDAEDLALLVLAWDDPGGEADLDGDGTVGIGDFLVMFMAK